MQKKNLIVVRCGDQSLHPQWLSDTAEFDVVLSYFGNTDAYRDTPVKAIHYCKGSKWEGLQDYFANHTDWQEYDAIWIPDDDIATTAEQLNAFFKLFHQHQFDLAQPSLRQDSYYSWGICLQNTSFIYRQTDFVEVMVPCFTRASLQHLLPTFAVNKSGWGIEFLWNKFLGEQAKIGIIDAVAVHHTRPVSSAGNGMGDGQQQLSPMQEMMHLLQTYQVPHQSTVLSGMTHAQQLLSAESPHFTKLMLAGSAEVLFEHLQIQLKRHYLCESAAS